MYVERTAIIDCRTIVIMNGRKTKVKAVFQKDALNLCTDPRRTAQNIIYFKFKMKTHFKILTSNVCQFHCFFRCQDVFWVFRKCLAIQN